MSPIEFKRNLEAALRESHLGSGGMRIVQCSVSIDSAVGLVKVDLAVNKGALPIESVEDLTYTSFQSVGIAAFGDWQDITFDHSSRSVSRIHAEGLYVSPSTQS